MTVAAIKITDDVNVRALRVPATFATVKVLQTGQQGPDAPPRAALPPIAFAYGNASPRTVLPSSFFSQNSYLASPPDDRGCLKRTLATICDLAEAALIRRRSRGLHSLNENKLGCSISKTLSRRAVPFPPNNSKTSGVDPRLTQIKRSKIFTAKERETREKEDESAQY